MVASDCSRKLRVARYGLRFRVAVALLLCLVCTGIATAQRITVMVPDVQDAARSYYTDVLVPAFEQETGIEVELILMSWAGFIDQFVALHAAGQAPDVAQLGGADLGTFVLNGLIRPLNEWTDGWEGLSDFSPAAVADGMVDGKLYSIAYRLDQRPLMYRADLFEESGLDGGQPPTDWDELLDFAKKLVRYDDAGEIVRAGFNTASAGDLVSIFVFQNGGRLVSPDGTRITINSPEAVGAVQFLADMVLEHRVGWPGGAPWEGAHGIVTGRTAMAYTGDWNLGAMAEWDPDNAHALQVAIPAGNVNNSGFLYVNKWIMSSQTQNPEAAWKWIEFVSRPEIMYELSRLNSFLPPRRSALIGSPFTDDPRWGVIFASSEQTIPLPGNVYNLARVMTHLSQATAKVFNREEPVTTALENATQQAAIEVFGGN